ncbi:uncharacterized protein FN964_012412 [Alca torda]
MKTAQPPAGQTNAACCCLLVALQNKHWKKQLPGHIQKYLAEEKKKEELAEKEKRKRRTRPATKAKPPKSDQRPKRKLETSQAPCQKSSGDLDAGKQHPPGTGLLYEGLPVQKSSSSEQPSVSPLTGMEMEESSPDLLETMLEECEEAGEEPLAVHEDDTVPPKRSLSPRTHQALREVVTCILGQVARKRRGQRDDQRDLQDKLKCELAVLQWRRSGKEARSGQQPQEAGPQPVPPARPEKRREEPVRGMGSWRDCVISTCRKA